MRNWLLLSLLAAVSASAQSQSGTLYTLDFVGGNVGVFAVDPATGAATLVATTDAVTIPDNTLAFDPAGRRLFFRAGSDLYTVHVDTGSYSRVADTGAPLEFDPVSGQLYTVGVVAGAATVYAVDPLTGTATVVAITDTPSVSDGASAFDPTRRRFFFRSSSEVYVVDITTGTFTHFTAGGSLLAFDPATGEIYMLDFVGAAVAVFAINPATQVTRQLVVTDAPSNSGTLVFDAATRRLFFRSLGEVYTVDVDSGLFTHLPVRGFELLFAAAHSTSIPTLSTTMLLALTLGLAGWAALKLR